LDNCNIHHSKEVHALVEDEAGMFRSYYAATLVSYSMFFLGCKLVFLPPYSPDLNPIEQAFSAIKVYLKRFCNEFTFSIIDGACQNISSESAWGFFCASGYVV
jgi:transposase